jgi:hypothetical protein
VKKIVTIIPDSADLLPDPLVAERYQVHLRTLYRWDDRPALGFPKPIRINGRKYRRVNQLETWERWRAANEERCGGTLQREEKLK